jgi:mono/diheme cytochrome c family protein
MSRTLKTLVTMIAVLTVCLPSMLAPRGAFAADAETEKIYLDKCSVCHGQDGAAKTAKGKKLKIKDVRSPELQKMTEAQFAEAIMKGKGKDMDAFEKELGKDMSQKLAVLMKELAKK